MLGSLLATLSFLFYQRGVTGGFKERWRVAMQRFNGWPRVLTTVFFIAWLGSGAFIYYNVSYLNNYYTATETRNRTAQYEKTLKKYQNLPQPKVTTVLLKADIFPDERRIQIAAKLFLKNKSGEPINEFHLLADQNVAYSILYNGKSLGYTSPLATPYSVFTFFKKGKDTLNYRIYKLPATMQPGDTGLLEVSSSIANQGFLNNGFSREILKNGTFYSGGIPAFGYDQQRELESDEYRKKNGLSPKEDDLPAHTDTKGRNTILFNDDADMIHFEAVVSTTADQVAIAPGYLQKTWEEKGRKYFSYIQDSPTIISSAWYLQNMKY